MFRSFSLSSYLSHTERNSSTFCKQCISYDQNVTECYGIVDIRSECIINKKYKVHIS